MERDGVGAFEWLLIGLATIGVATIGVVWAGAVLGLAVSGTPHGVPFLVAAGAVPRLVHHLARPAEAWPEPFRHLLPVAPLYWACTVVAAVGIGSAVGCGARWLGGSTVGTAARRPLGVDGRARFARSRDLRSVLVDRPVAGRFVIARFGRRLVATEAPPGSRERGGRGRIVRIVRAVGSAGRAGRRGDRGAVALIGPSRSGKTTAAIAGILEWEGPAVLSSVKSDLLGSTVGWRSRVGEVRVYDPTGSTSFGSSAVWSPLAQAGTVGGAQRAARALCDAAPRGGVEGGMDFWLAQAEILLTALLFVAHHARRDMSAVCDWVLTQDRPGELGPGEVRTALNDLYGRDDEVVVAGSVEVAKGLLAVWGMEDRTRSSIYATAQTLIWPWTDPGVAASAPSPLGPDGGEVVGGIDADWLLGGANTVYLCAPIEDQRRLAPAFGGLLNDVINQVYRRVGLTGRPLDPPLLVVIDEAGNTPLRSLPEYVSTLAGMGVLVVTVWQSLAQIEAAYAKSADTVLTNHLTKVFYAGLSDPASLRYVDRILGEAEVDTRSRSMAGRAQGRSDQFSTTRVPLAPAHVLRQMRPGDALLVHSTLPPAHVRTRPFYRHRHLAERAALAPVEPTVEPDPVAATHTDGDAGPSTA